MFSKTCIYAIKIMIYISIRDTHGTPNAGLQEIAQAIDSPRPFTAKILQQLAKYGLLKSVPGPGGGFALRENSEISLAEIVLAIDGDALMSRCVLGFEACSDEHPCPVHYKFRGIRDYLNNTLNTTTMDELKEVFYNEPIFLKG